MNEEDLSGLPHILQIRMLQYYQDMKSAERGAADFVVRNSSSVRGLTIRELSQKAGCSVATVSRMARKLGFDGFPGLKQVLSGWRDDPHGDSAMEGISWTDDVPTVIRKVFLATRDSILDTMELSGGAPYERALEAIVSARRIVFCGLGDAAAVANEACKRFLRMGSDCHTSEDADTQLLLATHLGPRDVLVAISHTGRSVTVMEAMKRGRKAGAHIILVTNFPASPLAKHADSVLPTAAFSVSATGEVISRRVAELCVLESLYVNCILKKGKEAAIRIAESEEAVLVHKIRSQEG